MSVTFLGVSQKVRGLVLYDLCSGLQRWWGSVEMVSRRQLSAVVVRGVCVWREFWTS